MSDFHMPSPPLPTMSNTNLAPNFTATPETNRTEDCDRSGGAARSFLIFAYSLVFLMSLALNTITMRVYFCTSQRLQSSVTIYLKNLAAADFCLCLVLPLRIANYASNSIIIRKIYCNFAAAGFYLNMYASILFMEYIAANRYLKIVHPLQTHALQSVRAARTISSITWVGLCGTASVYVMVFLYTSKSGNAHGIGCKSLHSDQVRMVYKGIHLISAVIFSFVSVSLILFYWGTVRKLQHTQFAEQSQKCNNRLSKSKRNMLVLVLVFCVCFMPYHFVRLPYIFQNLEERNCVQQTMYIVKEVAVLFSALNGCMDPLIYFIFCKDFRAQLTRRRGNITSSQELNKVSLDKIVEDERQSKILDSIETGAEPETDK